MRAELPTPPGLRGLETVAIAGEAAWVFGQCRDEADPYAPCHARWTGSGWQGGTLESDRAGAPPHLMAAGQASPLLAPAHYK